MSLNPNAREFKMSASAVEWVPKFAVPAPAAAPLPTPPPAPAPAPAAATEEGDEGDDAIDENDPLWIATLKVAEGDREKAVRMLENPDALMQYPEIRAIMEAQDAADEELARDMEKVAVSSAADEDWENSAATVISAAVPSASVATEEEDAVEAATPSKSVKSTASSAVAVEDEGEGEVAVVLEESDPREHLNLVFIGHVDAGKSTLSGCILYNMGMVDARTIERFEREAKQRNRESWFLAFILDTSEEERAKGITVEVGRAHFETPTYRFTILDAPGHKNYVPNMISGASQADVGILVISARKGEFETGFEKGGQTREHALLAKTLGVQYLIVVINKMDDPTVQWEVARYEECVGKLKPFLKSCGYVIKTEVKFLPISGLKGYNILNEVPEDVCPWWKPMYTTAGHNTTTPTLISTFDSLKLRGRNPEAALRIPCMDRYFERGCVVMGKIESGTLRLGDEVAVAPTRKKAKVEAIFVGEKAVASAKTGENVNLKVQLAVEDVQKGYVLCSPNNVVQAVVEVEVQLALVDMPDHRPLFSPGYDGVMHVHCVETEVVCKELLAVIVDGKKLKRPFARQGQQCIAILSLPISACMETYANLPSMGRLTIRDEGKTVAIGKIIRLIK